MKMLLASLVVMATAATAEAQPAAFKIVVIEGEDAVNIIQQKTAVRPIVEVRDRNNLPVAGVLVTFSIEGGKAATFAGASTLTVATNAAGQAAVSGLTPSVAGAFQIQVSAVAQGQLVTATIAQTNVLTAAQAAAAGASAASGGSAGSAGGGAGGAGGGAGGARRGRRRCGWRRTVGYDDRRGRRGGCRRRAWRPRRCSAKRTTSASQTKFSGTGHRHDRQHLVSRTCRPARSLERHLAP